MEIEKYLNGYRYTLTNENLQVGDRVYSIVSGRVREDNTFIISDIQFVSKYNKDFNTSGFPEDPAIIENLKHSDYKPYEVRTNKGYGPIETYFKIKTIEEKILTHRESGPLKFTNSEWVYRDVKETIDKMINELKSEEK